MFQSLDLLERAVQLDRAQKVALVHVRGDGCCAADIDVEEQRVDFGLQGPLGGERWQTRV